MEFIDLVLDTGELVRIACPGAHIDECYETLENAVKRGNWWSPAMFDKCRAEFLGISMDRVNMRRVVGTL